MRVSVAAYDRGVETSGRTAVDIRRRHPVQINYASAIAIGVAFAGFIGLLLWLPNPVSGADGGNWLALSLGFVGVHANAASTVYPPGFHLLLLAAQLVLPPLEALRVTGAAVSVLPGLGSYWLLRELRCGRLAFAGLGVALSGFSLEMLAWGGYPQLMGIGLAIAAEAALLVGLRAGSRSRLAIAGVLSALTVLTHHVVALQAVIWLGTTALIAIAAAGPALPARARHVLLFAGVSAAASIPAVPTYITLLTHAGTSAFNANGFDLTGVLQYLTNDGPVLWLTLAAFVPLAIALRVWERAWSDVGVLVGLAVASIGLMLLTDELRTAYLTQPLAIASTAIVFSRLLDKAPRVPRFLLTAVASLLFLTVAWAGLQRLDRSVRFYAVLDPSVVEGLEWLSHHREANDLAVVSEGRGKWPLGWWVEGISHVPSYMDYDPRWLYFSEEKKQAAIATAILATDDPQLAAAQARAHAISLIVIDTRDFGRADTWLRSGRVVGDIGLIYTNPSLVVFRVAHSS